MNPKRGILLKLAAVAAFVVMQALIKALDGRVPAGEVVFFRSLAALPVILVWLAWQRELKVGLKTNNLMGHFWRGAIGTLAMGLGFAGLAMLPLPEVTALQYAAPILVVVFAAMFLGEQVRVFRLTAVALGMIGVLIVLSPRLTALSEGQVEAVQALGAVIVLMSAVFAALAQIFVRNLVQRERAATVVLYFMLTSMLLSLLTIPYGWVMPTAFDLAVLVAVGLLGGVGQGLMTSAYRFADASVIAPFDYASMLLAIIVGYVVFAEVPTLATLSGAALIVLAGILIIWRESRLGMERDRARKVMTPQG